MERSKTGGEQRLVGHRRELTVRAILPTDNIPRRAQRRAKTQDRQIQDRKIEWLFAGNLIDVVYVMCMAYR